MNDIETSTIIFSSNSVPVATFVIILITLVAVAVYSWKRLSLYYCSAVLPGPLSFPFIGTPKIVFAGWKNVFSTFDQLMEIYPSVWRYWIGPELLISSTRLTHVEYFLTNHFNKEHIIAYRYIEEYCSSILTSNLDKWKPHRKIVNPSFNQRIINSFHPIFVKCTNKLIQVLEISCAKNDTEILPKIWRCTLDAIFETVGGVNPKMLTRKNTKFIPQIIRFEELLVKRLFSPHYYFRCIWQMTPFHKELVFLAEDMKIQIRELVDHHCTSKIVSSTIQDDFYENKSFVKCLIEGGLSQAEIEDEIMFMFVAGSETTAITICQVLLILSIYPDVQEKIQQEQQEIFGGDDREITLEDVTKFDYLERVIKETMRVLPAAPIISRYVEEAVNLDSVTFPKGCIVSFPIWRIHKDPAHWPNPSKFDPDRFLPQKVNERSRCAYIPFSYGSRNCVGQKYGMVVMKLILASLLRCFEVKSGKYKTFEEVEISFHLVSKPKDGFHIQLQRRC